MQQTNTIIILLFTGCIYSYNQSTKPSDGSMTGTVDQQKEVISMLDSFNIAAANADYKTYFNFFTDYAVFTGTDATERWDKKNIWHGQNPISIKKLPGILLHLSATFILTHPVPTHGLMSC